MTTARPERLAEPGRRGYRQGETPVAAAGHPFRTMMMTMNTTRRPDRGRPSALRAAILAAASAIFLAAPGAAVSQDAAPLRWKFTDGQALHYRMVQKTKTRVNVAGRDVTTNVTQTTNTTWKVKSVNPDGSARLSQTIDSISTKIESPFATVEYDSAHPEKAPEGPLAAGIVPTLKALVGTAFEYKMAPNGELSDVKVPKGLVDTLKKAGPSAGGMFSEDGLKNMITEMSLILDDQPTWRRTTEMPIPPIGKLKLTKTYRREEAKTDAGNAKIAMTVNIALEKNAEPDAAKNAPDLKVDLGDQKGTGVFAFDAKAGRVVSAHAEQSLVMKITVANMDSNQTTDTTTDMTYLPDGKGDDKGDAPAPK